jgi:outer membrane protein assembly factor BamB
MNDQPTETPPGDVTSDSRIATRFRTLRTWPAALLVGLMLAARYGPTLVEGGLGKYWMIAVFGPLLCCLLMLVWWVTASRATWKERLFGFLGLVGALALTLLLVDPTMRGPGTSYLTLPMGMIAFGLAAIALSRRSPGVRTGMALLFAFAGFGFSILLRNEGMTGDYQLGTHWRWLETPEASMLARTKVELPATVNETKGNRSNKINGERQSADKTKTAKPFSAPEWPGFRGPDRAAHTGGPQIATNWVAHPPEPLWKIAVGPAWSSFAVAGQRLFTQEQRGPMETVVCYDATTGQEIWKCEIKGRLDDPLGGPGPRATPTLSNDGLYVTGATGACLRLNPATGEINWKKDLAAMPGRKLPMWGFAASPLVAKDLVIVFAAGSGDKSLIALDAASGATRWSAPAGTDSYASPQLSTIAGEEVILMLSNDGLVLVDPTTGAVRLNYDWKFAQYRALQPQVVGNDTILLPTGMNTGTRAIRVSKTTSKADDKSQSGAGTKERLTSEELWTSRSLKPDFTDLVAYHGYAYGNDAGIWTCIDLKNGERKWKGGRYGKGQALLLENSGLLLIAAESGQVVLVSADPNEYREIASFKALEGKTWNHPVLVGDRLYVRNAQEAAAYRLPLAQKSIASLHATSLLSGQF